MLIYVVRASFPLNALEEKLKSKNPILGVSA